MKKSIAFLGALLFGSVTFAQVNKNDTINKPSSRKVSAEDLKKLPPETETSEKSSIFLKIGDIKGEKTIKGESQKSDYLKVSPDNSSRIKGENMTIKGKGNDATTTEKKHVGNIKWTPGKVAKDSSEQKTKSSDMFMKMSSKKKE